MKNLRRIRRDYYEHMASQQDDYDNRRLIENKPGYGRHGQPVHLAFDHALHVATRPIEIDKFRPVYIGVDCGSNSLTPGVTFNQLGYSGQLRTLAEIFIGKSQMNTEQLGGQIRETLNRRFGGLARDVGALMILDPAANSGNSSSRRIEFTTAMELQHHAGIEAQMAPSNDPKARRGAIDKRFKRMVAAQVPAKIIDPECKGLIQGYAGGFHYQRRGDRVSPAPHKNEFSHVCEADEYAALGIDGMDASEGRFIRPEGQDGDYRMRTILAD